VTLTNLGVSNVAALEFVLTPSTGTYTVPGSLTASAADTQGGEVIREFQAFGTASVAVPEPSTFALLGGGLLAMVLFVRRKAIPARN
jgi:hypothetical protein